VSPPLVVVDADVLGRERTGDETYVENLLRELSELDHGLRLAALTRRPELVPAGVEAVLLPACSQIVRMSRAVPRALAGLRPALVHFQYALPPRCPAPGIVTVHDLSFEREPRLMGLADRILFRTVVPRSVRRAVRVLTVSERTKRDLVELYRVAPEKIIVIPNGVDLAFRPGPDARRDYALLVGAIQARKDPLAAADAAFAAGLPLVVAGPAKDPALARELERRGAILRGYVPKEELAELYRGAACLVFPSRYEGFGLPVLEAMACGTPVVATRVGGLQTVVQHGESGLLVPAGDHQALAAAIEQVLMDHRLRMHLAHGSRDRAEHFTWGRVGDGIQTLYRRVLGERGAPLEV